MYCLLFSTSRTGRTLFIDVVLRLRSKLWKRPYELYFGCQTFRSGDSVVNWSICRPKSRGVGLASFVQFFESSDVQLLSAVSWFLGLSRSGAITKWGSNKLNEPIVTLNTCLSWVFRNLGSEVFLIFFSAVETEFLFCCLLRSDCSASSTWYYFWNHCSRNYQFSCNTRSSCPTNRCVSRPLLPGGGKVYICNDKQNMLMSPARFY